MILSKSDIYKVFCMQTQQAKDSWLFVIIIFRRIIKKCSCVDIKQKAGCVSHIDDPTNLRSTFAYTLSTERYVCWRTHVRPKPISHFVILYIFHQNSNIYSLYFSSNSQPLNLLAFTNNSKVQNFINKFLTSEDELGEDSKFLQLFMLQFYHCLTKDTMHALHIYVDLLMSYFVQSHRQPASIFGN